MRGRFERVLRTAGGGRNRYARTGWLASRRSWLAALIGVVALAGGVERRGGADAGLGPARGGDGRVRGRAPGVSRGRARSRLAAGALDWERGSSPRSDRAPRWIPAPVSGSRA